MVDNNPVTLLYSDDAVLAFNKPAGLRTLPDGYQLDLPNLRDIIREQHGAIWIVHRLDKDTSGIILFARSAEAHRSLNLQFERREVRKEYHLLTGKAPGWDELSNQSPLRVNGDRRHRTTIDAVNGKPARTNFEVLYRYVEGAALLSARPETGYTHQIRAHITDLGFPILNDALYFIKNRNDEIGSGAFSPYTPQALKRLALHAFTVRFSHPLSGESIELTAPYTDDFLFEVSLLHPR